MTDLHSFVDFEHSGFATWTGFAGSHGAQVSPLIDLDIAFDIDTAKVMVIFVGAGGHVAATFQTQIGDDQQAAI